MRPPHLIGRVAIAAVATASMVPACSARAAPPSDVAEHRPFFAAAHEIAGNRVQLPALQGRTTDGRSFTYVVFDSSGPDDARARGVNAAPKLGNGRGTAGVMPGRYVSGVLTVPATVDFSPGRSVAPGPGGFPPATADPGSVAEPGYSPYVELPDGIVIDAPHVANASGLHDKVIAIGTPAGSVTLQETEGFHDHTEVYYVSTDASDRTVAAVESATWVPALAALPGLGSNDVTTSARAGIIPFINGQTGHGPERQGVNAQLLDREDPLNVTEVRPGEAAWTPAWDVWLARWTLPLPGRTRQVDFEEVAELAAAGAVVAPDGSPWVANGVVINCPIISAHDAPEPSPAVGAPTGPPPSASALARDPVGTLPTFPRGAEARPAMTRPVAKPCSSRRSVRLPQVAGLRGGRAVVRWRGRIIDVRREGQLRRPLSLRGLGPGGVSVTLSGHARGRPVRRSLHFSTC